MSCESCDSCQGCNSCEDCNSCEGVCDSYQGFCKNNQLASNHTTISDWGKKSTNSKFLTATEWNDFITSIYNAYCLGEKNNAWGNSTKTENEFALYPATSNDTEDPMDIRAGYGTGKSLGAEDIMYAQMYNGAIKKMRFLVNHQAGDNEVETGDVIYASAFNELIRYAKEDFMLNYSQCNDCNVGCNVSCDSCNSTCKTNQCNTSKTCCDDKPEEDGGE